MTNGRLYRLLTLFADIRPDETRQTLGFFCSFFLITVSIYIIKPVKESLLIGVTPAWWPYADFITAGLIGFVVAYHDRYTKKLPRRICFSRITNFFTLSLLVLWVILEAVIHGSGRSPFGLMRSFVERIWPIPVFVFSFWADVFIVTSVTHFWFFVSDIFSLNQAKRIVRFFVTGGLLGGIAGSLLTSRLVHAIGPVNLLLVCPFLFLVNQALIRRIYSRHGNGDRPGESMQPTPGYRDSVRILFADRYLRILAGFLASAVIMSSLINYQFKIIARDAMPDPGARTAFIGGYFFFILVLSAVFHFLTTGQILKRFGIRFSLLLAPTALLLMSLAVFMAPASGLILWACVLRGCEKTFDCTISQSVRELLYMPIPVSIKYRAKLYIDMFVNKLSVGLGAILFWILYRAGSFSVKSAAAQAGQLAIIVAGLAVVCIFLIWNIYSEYMGAVKRDLARKWRDAHSVLAESVDLDGARLVVDAMQSREKSSTLYAMSLFQLIKKEKLTPELIASLSCMEDEAKADSMDSLLDIPAGRLHREITETLTDTGIEAEVQKIVSLESYETIMESRLNELVRTGTDSEVERMEAAKLIGILKPTPGVRQCLDSLLRDESPNVLLYAMDSAAVHKLAESVPSIIRLLSLPAIMPVAQDALASYGPGIEDLLGVHLRNPSGDLNIRNSIPGILARIGTQKSADILTATLLHDSEDVKQSVIDGLYRIRSGSPGVHLKKKRIMAAVFARIAHSYDVYLAGCNRPAPRDPEPAAQDWRVTPDSGIKQIFDLLTLVYPAEDIIKAYQNILQGGRRSFDSSLELLDNILDRDLKRLLFPLIENLPPEEKARRLKRLRRNL